MFETVYQNGRIVIEKIQIDNNNVNYKVITENSCYNKHCDEFELFNYVNEETHEFCKRDLLR